MRGLITHREVLSNLGLIWREFGAGCLVRCIAACITRRHTTFLDVAWGPSPISGAEIIEDGSSAAAAGEAGRSC